MAAQKGRDLLIKIKTDAGSFKTIAGLRAKTLKLNSQSVDVTTSDSTGGWRELLPGAGVRNCEISGTGIFQDASTDTDIREAFFNRTAPEFQIVIPDFGILSGDFLISDLSYGGTYSGEATFDIALKSAGIVIFAVL